jgi:2,3-dihydroxybenzoate-AMP ligase
MLEGFVPWPKEYAKKYIEKGYWEGITLGEAFESWVEKYADRPALAYQGSEITYRQMDSFATRIAHQMTELGVKTYDRVILQLFNVPELVYVYYACMKIGAIPISSLPLHRWSEIKYIAEESKARVHVIPAGVVRDFNYEEFAEKIQAESPDLKVVLAVGKTANPKVHSINTFMDKELDSKTAKKKLAKYRADPMEPALFQLSGGTTGVPKIIPRTHNDYLYNAKCVASALEYNDKSRVIASTPLVHNVALVCLMLPLHSKGGCLVLPPSISPEGLLEAISLNKADTMGIVPVFIHRLLELPDEVRDKYDISSLRRIMGIWNPEDSTTVKFMEVFHCDGIQTYGMSEGLICWTRWTDPPEIRHKTSGSPVSEADECRVIDPETNQEVAPGQIGEMHCRGPYTIRGYYKSPERNKEAFTPDGYYKTGDLVRMDSERHITWTGRIKDTIDRGAEKINAEEVETYILKFNKVKQVAVIGMPDKALGERVCAFVVPQQGQTFELSELRTFLTKEAQVAEFKQPERLEFLDELPITKIGKYEKKSLREKVIKMLTEEGKI